MKLLQELLNEVLKIGDLRHQERKWRQHHGEKDWWVVTPSKKKYGPFRSEEVAKKFLLGRSDVDLDSRLISTPKDGIL